MDKTTIIVVEDNIVYCEFVCNMLAREGYRTVKAYHLSTAKKHLQHAGAGGLPHREGLPPLNREETSTTGDR